MKKRELIKFLILRTVGNFLVLFAVFGIVATFGPALYYEASYRILQIRGVNYVVSAASHIVDEEEDEPEISPDAQESDGIDNFGQVLAGSKEQILRPKDTDFGIVIPKIGANAKIFPNVDPASEEIFRPLLLQGVAHSLGTVFPGDKGNIYLFAHSTDNFWDVGRYNAIFYLIKDLKAGDEVVIFYKNKRHTYIVRESKIVDSSDVSYIVDAQKQDKEQLILQTCWPPGTTWQRLLVFAEPKQ